MKAALPAIIALSLAALAGCQSPAEKQTDAAEERVEAAAEASAEAAGSATAAFGLTETQLLEANLVDAYGTMLGDIEQVQRNAKGRVEGFLVELENTDPDPDRYVVLPLNGLTVRKNGGDTDLQTTLTPAQITALPDADMMSGNP